MQTRKALASFSASQERPFGSDLGEVFQQQAQANTQSIEEQKRARIEDFVSAPHLSVARKKLAETLSAQLSNNEAPCIMKFDAYQRVLHSRSASNIAHADTGLRRLGHQLKLAWERDPTGAFTVGNLERLRQHYAAQYPKSQASTVIGQDLPKHGFGTVDLQPLVRAAQEINTQEEYDNFIQATGLIGNSVGEIRSRALLKELVNKKQQHRASPKRMGQGKTGRKAQMETQQLYDELDQVDIGLSHKVQDLLEAAEQGQADDALAEKLSWAIADEDIRLSNEFEELYNGMTGQQVFARRGGAMRSFSITAAKHENRAMLEAVKRGEYSFDAVDGGHRVEAVSPPGWEEGVEKLKQHENGIDEPYALAWWMKDKGYAEPGTAKKSMLKLSAEQRKKLAYTMRNKRKASRRTARAQDLQIFIGKPSAPADGEWLDVENLNSAEMESEAKRIVAPEEEWIISDYDLGGIEIGETEDFQTIEDIVQLFDEFDPAAVAAARDIDSNADADALRSILQEQYHGSWSSEEEYAQNLVDDLGGIGQISNPEFYFDWEAYTRDLFINDYSGIESGGQVHVFSRY